MYQQLFKNLSSSDVIITANRRLAAYLYERHSTWQQQNPINHWMTPTILPLDSWLEQHWQANQINANGTPLTLLTSNQELIIWQQIIRESVAGKNLLQINHSAQLAQEAWQLIQQWHVDFNSPYFSQTEDTVTWQTWANTFKKYCVDNNYVDIAHLPYHLTRCIQQSSNVYPKKIFLVGFVELTPAIKSLLITLEKQNCSAQLITPDHTATTINKLALNNTQAEIQIMARWCQQQLNNNSHNTIGCVVPDLLTQRTTLVNTFNRYNLPFNISGGLQLHEYPIIHNAFTLLNIAEVMPLEIVSALLRSPFLGSAEQEMTARAELDVLLRKQGHYEMLCQQVITLAKQRHCPVISQQLQAFIVSQQKQKKILHPSQWALLFSQQLTLLGWPGERTLSSDEYQLYERWQKLLAELATLDRILNAIDANTARYHLYQLACTPFQARSSNTRIQILGALEATGLQFQQLWIMGMHDAAWPPPAKPNPFIPHILQRELKLPHASSERELKFCHTLTDQFSHSATQIIFSFPQQEEDRALRISQLISHLPTINIEDLNLSNVKSELITLLKNPARFEYFIDSKAPAMRHDEKITGGSAVLAYQAACPFRAFARFRLGAENLAEINLGLSAKDKGSLLHRVLEIFWNTVNDQATLLNLTEIELQKTIQQTIDTALIAAVKKHPLILQKNFTELEKKRLTILLYNWLAQEKQRPAFKVLATEQNQNFTVGPIPLQLRVDRIDELADDVRIIIDYKTGNINTSSWFGERPDEPQLPMYCIANAPQINGLVFAQIKNNKAIFQGAAEQAIQINGVKTIENWPALLQDWQRELTKLAEEFYQGHANADPKHQEQTCQHCDLQLLCRIKEQ